MERDVIHDQLRLGIDFVYELEPLDDGLGSLEIEEILVRHRLIHHVPLIAPAGERGDFVANVIEQDFLQILRAPVREIVLRLAEERDAIPLRQDEIVPAHPVAALVHPGERADGDIAILHPLRPFQSAFIGAAVEELGELFAIAIGIRVFHFHDAGIGKGGAEAEARCFLHPCHVDLRPGHRLAGRIHDLNGQIAFADFFDSLGGGGAPGRIGLATGIGVFLVRQGIGADPLREIQHAHIRNLHDLGRHAHRQRENHLPRRHGSRVMLHQGRPRDIVFLPVGIDEHLRPSGAVARFFRGEEGDIHLPQARFRDALDGPRVEREHQHIPGLDVPDVRPAELNHVVTIEPAFFVSI